MTFPEDVTHGVAGLIVEWLAESPSEPAQLAQSLIAVQDAIRQLQGLQADIESRLVAILDAPLTVPGLGTFERRGEAKSHHWDHDRLMSVVIAQAAANRIPDTETGEIVSVQTAVEKVLLEVAHIDYWRIQALDRHGIEGRKYRVTEWGRKRVKYTPESEQPPEGG